MDQEGATDLFKKITIPADVFEEDLNCVGEAPITVPFQKIYYSREFVL